MVKRKKEPPQKPGACLFCNSNEDDELKYGKLIFHAKSNIRVHHYCLLFASGLCQRGEGNEENGIEGFLVPDIEEEYKRGKQLRCVYCHNKTATVGCVIKACRSMYHFGCGVEKKAIFLFYDNFISYCCKHRPQQEPPELPSENPTSTCPICLESVDAKVSEETLRTPCCTNTWFHRICVQRQALSAGYFFRCGICNNKEDFQREMKQFGIYIPEQDAAWELEENAYQELYQRHNQCDMQPCICPKGRKYHPSRGKWEIVLCDTCGSRGCHLTCGGLTNQWDEWDCDQCADVMERVNAARCGQGSKPKKSSSSKKSSTKKTTPSETQKEKLSGKSPRTPLPSRKPVKKTENAAPSTCPSLSPPSPSDSISNMSQLSIHLPSVSASPNDGAYSSQCSSDSSQCSSSPPCVKISTPCKNGSRKRGRDGSPCKGSGNSCRKHLPLSTCKSKCDSPPLFCCTSQDRFSHSHDKIPPCLSVEDKPQSQKQHKGFQLKHKGHVCQKYGNSTPSQAVKTTSRMSMRGPATCTPTFKGGADGFSSLGKAGGNIHHHSLSGMHLCARHRQQIQHSHLACWNRSNSTGSTSSHNSSGSSDETDFDTVHLSPDGKVPSKSLPFSGSLPSGIRKIAGDVSSGKEVVVQLKPLPNLIDPEGRQVLCHTVSLSPGDSKSQGIFGSALSSKLNLGTGAQTTYNIKHTCSKRKLENEPSAPRKKFKIGKSPPPKKVENKSPLPRKVMKKPSTSPQKKAKLASAKKVNLATPTTKKDKSAESLSGKKKCTNSSSKIKAGNTGKSQTLKKEKNKTPVAQKNSVASASPKKKVKNGPLSKVNVKGKAMPIKMSFSTSKSKPQVKVLPSPQKATVKVLPSPKKTQVKVGSSPKKVSVKAVSSPKKVSVKAVSSPKKVSVKAVSSPKKVSVKAVSSPKKVSVKAVSSPKKVSVKVVSSSKKVSVKAVSSPKKVSVKAVSSPKKVSVKVVSSPKKVSVKPVSSPKKASVKADSSALKVSSPKKPQVKPTSSSKSRASMSSSSKVLASQKKTNKSPTKKAQISPRTKQATLEKYLKPLTTTKQTEQSDVRPVPQTKNTKLPTPRKDAGKTTLLKKNSSRNSTGDSMEHEVAVNDSMSQASSDKTSQVVVKISKTGSVIEIPVKNLGPSRAAKDTAMCSILTSKGYSTKTSVPESKLPQQQHSRVEERSVEIVGDKTSVPHKNTENVNKSCSLEGENTILKSLLLSSGNSVSGTTDANYATTADTGTKRLTRSAKCWNARIESGTFVFSKSPPAVQTHSAQSKESPTASGIRSGIYFSFNEPGLDNRIAEKEISKVQKPQAEIRVTPIKKPSGKPECRFPARSSPRLMKERTTTLTVAADTAAMSTDISQIWVPSGSKDTFALARVSEDESNQKDSSVIEPVVPVQANMSKSSEKPQKRNQLESQKGNKPESQKGNPSESQKQKRNLPQMVYLAMDGSTVNKVPKLRMEIMYPDGSTTHKTKDERYLKRIAPKKTAMSQDTCFLEIQEFNKTMMAAASNVIETMASVTKSDVTSETCKVFENDSPLKAKVVSSLFPEGHPSKSAKKPSEDDKNSSEMDELLMVDPHSQNTNELKETHQISQVPDTLETQSGSEDEDDSSAESSSEDVAGVLVRRSSRFESGTPSKGGMLVRRSSRGRKIEPLINFPARAKRNKRACDNCRVTKKACTHGPLGSHEQKRQKQSKSVTTNSAETANSKSLQADKSSTIDSGGAANATSSQVAKSTTSDSQDPANIKMSHQEGHLTKADLSGIASMQLAKQKQNTESTAVQQDNEHDNRSKRQKMERQNGELTNDTIVENQVKKADHVAEEHQEESSTGKIEDNTLHQNNKDEDDRLTSEHHSMCKEKKPVNNQSMINGVMKAGEDSGEDVTKTVESSNKVKAKQKENTSSTNRNNACNRQEDVQVSDEQSEEGVEPLKQKGNGSQKLQSSENIQTTARVVENVEAPMQLSQDTQTSKRPSKSSEGSKQLNNSRKKSLSDRTSVKLGEGVQDLKQPCEDGRPSTRDTESGQAAVQPGDSGQSCKCLNEGSSRRAKSDETSGGSEQAGEEDETLQPPCDIEGGSLLPEDSGQVPEQSKEPNTTETIEQSDSDCLSTPGSSPLKPTLSPYICQKKHKHKAACKRKHVHYPICDSPHLHGPKAKQRKFMKRQLRTTPVHVHKPKCLAPHLHGRQPHHKNGEPTLAAEEKNSDKDAYEAEEDTTLQNAEESQTPETVKEKTE